MARWFGRLQEFDFTIVHHRGKKIKNAYLLSQLPCHQCSCENHGQELIVASISLSETVNFLQEKLNDSTIGPVLRIEIKGQGNLILRLRYFVGNQDVSSRYGISL